MWNEDDDYRDTMATQVKLRLLVEFFIWLLTAPMSQRTDGMK